MTLHYRTGKQWHDPDLDGFLLDWRIDANDNTRLIVDLDYSKVVEARKDNSIATGKISEWRVRDRVFDTKITTLLPAGGIMRVIAVED